MEVLNMIPAKPNAESCRQCAVR